MKKRHIFKIAAAIAALLCTSGCAVEKTAEKKLPSVMEQPSYEWGTVSGRTISVWGRESDLSRSYIHRAFQRYEELTGNTVRIVAFSPEDIETEVIRALSDDESGLDLLLYYGGTNIEAFDPDENFYDFSDAAWVDDLTDVSINQAIYHGKVVGLPHWEASVSGTLYNKTLFKKLGITPPRTQAEFQQVCQTLKENGVTPLYLPCGEPSMLLYQFPLDTIVNQGGVLEAVNGGALSYSEIQEMYSVVEWYRGMAQNGYLGEDYINNDWAGMNDAMVSGKYGMMLCWDTWLYTDFSGNASDFGLMPAFIGVPEQGTFEGPNLAMLMVNRHGEQLDAALDLITFMADPYNYNDAFEGIYTAPVFRKQMASISTPQYVDAASWIEKNFNDSVAWLSIKGFSQLDASCIVKSMSQGGYSPEQCLKDMDALRLNRISNIRN